MIIEGIVQVFIKYAVVLNVILRGIDDFRKESAVGTTDSAPSGPKSTPVAGDSLENTDVLPENKLYIIERETWLAQPPSKSAPKLRHPVPYVIISQTSTNPCKTQADCTYRVRVTQTYDIESQDWNDIGCNFMIGGDGYAYEGRGWEAVGEGLNGYEPRSIGISFIGTFKNDEPPSIQLKAAEKLIKLGVEGGRIAPDYKLLALRQIARTSNPGDALYDIIQKWPHWNDSFGETPGATLDEIGHPRFVEREAWGAKPPTGTMNNLTLPVPYVMISHTATTFCETQSECSGIVRSVQSFHAESRHWSDITYNFLVGGDGYVYVGRGWDTEGAHSYGYNKKSIGISFVGTFNDVSPPRRQLLAAQQLIDLGIEKGKVQSDYILLGHRQVSRTLSPGNVLYDIIKTWPHWSSQP